MGHLANLNLFALQSFLGEPSDRAGGGTHLGRLPPLDSVTSFIALSQTECVIGDGDGWLYYITTKGVVDKLQVGVGRIDKLLYRNNNLAVLTQSRDEIEAESQPQQTSEGVGEVGFPVIRVVDMSQRAKGMRLRSMVLVLAPLVHVTCFDCSGDLRVFCIGGLTSEQISNNRAFLSSSTAVGTTGVDAATTKPGGAFQVSSSLMFVSGELLSSVEKARITTCPIQGVVSNVVVVSIKLGTDTRVMHVYFSTAPCYNPSVPLKSQYNRPIYPGEVYGTITPLLIRSPPRFVKLLSIGAMPNCAYGGRFCISGDGEDEDTDSYDRTKFTERGTGELNELLNTNDSGWSEGRHSKKVARVDAAPLDDVGMMRKGDKHIRFSPLTESTSDSINNNNYNYNDHSQQYTSTNSPSEIDPTFSAANTKTTNTTTQQIQQQKGRRGTTTSILTVATNNGIQKVGFHITEFSSVSSTLIGVLGSHINKIMNKVIENTKIITFNDPVEFEGLKRYARGGGNHSFVMLYDELAELNINSCLGIPTGTNTRGTICCINLDSNLCSLRFRAQAASLSFAQDRAVSLSCILHTTEGMRGATPRGMDGEGYSEFSLPDHLLRNRLNLLTLKMIPEKDCLDEMFKHNLADLAMKHFAKKRTTQNQMMIFRKMADVKFAAQDFSTAMDSYIEALKLYSTLDADSLAREGYVFDTSDVVVRYSTKLQFSELARFLEVLIHLGKATSDHIELLVTLYTKNGNEKAILKFVETIERDIERQWRSRLVVVNSRKTKDKKNTELQSSSSPFVSLGKVTFDVEPVVNLLVENEYLVPALRLALVGGLYGEALGILAFGKGNRGDEETGPGTEEERGGVGGVVRGRPDSRLRAKSPTKKRVHRKWKREAGAESNTGVLPSIDGAIALLCTFDIEEIHSTLLIAIGELLKARPEAMVELLCHLCTGWSVGRYVPQASSAAKTNEVSSILSNFRDIIMDRDGVQASATSSQRSDESSISNTVSSVLSILAPHTQQWARFYTVRRVIELQLADAARRMPDDTVVQELCKDIIGGGELDDLVRLGAGQTSGQLPRRMTSRGEMVEYLPLSLVLPYIIEYETAQLRHPEIQYTAVDLPSPTKQLIMTVTKYGTRDPSFVRPRGANGVSALAPGQVEEQVVHILLECLFKEIQTVRDEVENAGGTVLEDTGEIIWGDELLIDLGGPRRQKDQSQDRSSGIGGMLGERRKEELGTSYKCSTGLLMEILNDRLTPEEGASRVADGQSDGEGAGLNVQLTTKLPYDPFHVLHLAATYSYSPAALSVYIARGDVLAQMNYHMERQDTKAVLDIYFSSVINIRRHTPEKGDMDDSGLLTVGGGEDDSYLGVKSPSHIGPTNTGREEGKTSSQPLFWEELVMYLIKSGEDEELDRFLEMIAKSVDATDIIKVMSSVSCTDGLLPGDCGYDGRLSSPKSDSNSTHKNSSLLSAKESIRRRVEDTRVKLAKMEENIKSKSKECVDFYKTKAKEVKADEYDEMGSLSPETADGARLTPEERQYNDDGCCVCDGKMCFPIVAFKCGHVAHMNCYSREANVLTEDLAKLDKERDVPMYGLKTMLNSCSNYFPYCPRCIKERSLPVVLHLNTVVDDEIAACRGFDAVMSLFRTQKYSMMSGLSE